MNSSEALRKLSTFDYKEKHMCLICQENQAIASHTISQKNLMNFLWLNKKQGCILYQKHTALSHLMLKLKNEKKKEQLKEKQKHLKTNVRVASTVPAFCTKCEPLFTLTDNPQWLNKINEIDNTDKEQLVYELLLKSLAWEIKQIEKNIKNDNYLLKNNDVILESLKPVRESKELEKKLSFLKNELYHILELKKKEQILAHFTITITSTEINCIDLKIK